MVFRFANGSSTKHHDQSNSQTKWERLIHQTLWTQEFPKEKTDIAIQQRHVTKRHILNLYFYKLAL